MIERLLEIDPESSLTGWSLHFRADWPLMILALLVLAVVTAAAFYYCCLLFTSPSPRD